MLSRDDVLRMAADANAEVYMYSHGDYSAKFTNEGLARFAYLVAAAERARERELCARICDAKSAKLNSQDGGIVLDQCAAAIRARGV